MTDQGKGTAGAAPEGADGIESGLRPQMAMMLRALLASPVRNALLTLGGVLTGVVILTAYGQILLNAWNKPFYDALARRDLGEFFYQLGVFGMIAGGLLVLNVGQRWLVETSKLKLREGLAKDLIENWLQPMRAFRLASAGAIGVNPDQRMHEDARHLTELSADLGTQLLQAGVLVGSFVSVLWRISSGFTFHFHGHAYVIAGYMVWAAVIYAGSASLLSYWVGRSLIARNAERYAREADLRFSLVRVNEHVDSIALANGEAHEARRIELDVAAVLAATRRLVLGLTNLTWVTAGYGWFTLVAPILAAAPLYFSNDLSFGGLMMAAGAFTQVQTSLRWFVDNFSVLADWRATLLRVATFRRAMVTMDTLHCVESQINYREGSAGALEIDELEVASPAGATMLKERHVRLQSGDRVLIAGRRVRARPCCSCIGGIVAMGLRYGNPAQTGRGPVCRGPRIGRRDRCARRCPIPLGGGFQTRRTERAQGVASTAADSDPGPSHRLAAAAQCGGTERSGHCACRVARSALDSDG
jgi:putative ATP-binding cassette transporter